MKIIGLQLLRMLALWRGFEGDQTSKNYEHKFDKYKFKYWHKQTVICGRPLSPEKFVEIYNKVSNDTCTGDDLHRYFKSVCSGKYESLNFAPAFVSPQNPVLHVEFRPCDDVFIFVPVQQLTKSDLEKFVGDYLELCQGLFEEAKHYVPECIKEHKTQSGAE